jgi:thiol-disulfide isomerase/thioredoxin
MICFGGICIPYSSLLPLVLVLFRPLWEMVRKWMGWDTATATATASEKKEKKKEIKKETSGETAPLCSTAEKSHESDTPAAADEPNTIVLGEGMDWNDLISSAPFVICRFTAKWCKPCHALEPIFFEAASKNPDMKFVTVDVDEHDDLFAGLGILGIPHLQCYVRGELKNSLSGSNSSKITETLEELRSEASSASLASN